MKTSKKSVTAFQKRVYDALCRIPKGKVSTYQALGKAIGCKSPRAVGQALRCNPFAPQVPCHRVISSDLKIGGYSGEISGAKITKKLGLLKNEGVLFQNGTLIDKKRLFLF